YQRSSPTNPTTGCTSRKMPGPPTDIHNDLLLAAEGLAPSIKSAGYVEERELRLCVSAAERHPNPLERFPTLAFICWAYEPDRVLLRCAPTIDLTYPCMPMVTRLFRSW